MPEQACTQQTKHYRIMGIISVIAALLLSVADYLLEFHKEYGVSSSIVETAWVDMPHWRFAFSIYLCMFMIPFYLLGFYLIYKAVSKTNKTLAMVIFGLFSYGLVMGSPFIHGVMSLNGVIYTYGIQHGVSHEVLVGLIEGTLTGTILPVFLVHYILTWVVAPLLLFLHIIRKKSVFKRWTAFLNPLVFLLVGVLGLMVFPQLFAYLAPGAINKGNAAMFALATVSLWNGDAQVSK
ncbi:MAG: DUF6796 family protein [Sphaerochaeta sp.]|nr:hypothetical protein [Sphaerochaeta sp.]